MAYKQDSSLCDYDTEAICTRFYEQASTPTTLETKYILQLLYIPYPKRVVGYVTHMNSLR